MGLLDGLLGGSRRGRGGMSPNMMALLGMLAVAGYQNRDKLGDLLGQAGATGRDRAAGNGRLGGMFGNSGNGGGLGGMLGGLLGGAGGASMSGGLGDIIDRFTQTGQGEKARSWVASGPNQPVQATELETALGEDNLSSLQKQTGLSRQELLQRLSAVLPEAVDKMTPEGRLPH